MTHKARRPGGVGAGRGRAVAAALAALALSCLARGAAANAVPRQFFEAGRGGVVLHAGKGPPLRVARVDLELDFRAGGRGRSSSTYRLENEGDAAWGDDVIFVASADDVAVFVDGRPVEARPAGPEIEGLARGVEQTTWLTGQRAYAFRLDLAPRAGCDLRVTFRASPGVVRERVDDDRQADGLTRLVPRGDAYRPRAATFAYPLWPAVGFGGGVGAMRVVVRASEGAVLRAGRVEVERRARAGGEVEFRAVVPPTADRAGLAAAALELRYDLPEPAPLVGASAFVAARVLDAGGKGFGANARLSGDVVFFDRFGLSLGAETDFARTLAAVATVAKGAASVYGSGYLGAGAIVAAKPGVAAGFEVNAGARFFVVPLDLALQIYPYRDDRARDIGVVRLLVGLKAGL